MMGWILVLIILAIITSMVVSNEFSAAVVNRAKSTLFVLLGLFFLSKSIFLIYFSKTMLEFLKTHSSNRTLYRRWEYHLASPIPNFASLI